MHNSNFCCGEILLDEIPMKKSDVRICRKCGNIRDLTASRKYNSQHVEFELSGKDPLGRFITRLGVWKSY